MRNHNRRGWRAFVSPGWGLALVLVLLFTYFAFTFLAPWQLGKNKQKSEFNARLEHALEVAPVQAQQVLPRDGSPAGVDKEWTRVELRGHFLPDKEVILRNRTVDSAPVFQSLTPFVLDGGQTVLVNRGWAQAAEGNQMPKIPSPPKQELRISGFIRVSEPVPASEPAEARGYIQVTGMSTEQIARATGLRLASDYVQIDRQGVETVNALPGQVPPLQSLPLPHLDNGQNLSYGIQWIAFGIMAPVGLAWFVRAEVHERRREREEIAEAEALAARSGAAAPGPAASSAGAPGASEASTPASPSDATDHRASRPQVGERKLADRYGGTRSRFEERRRERGGERF